MEEELTPQDKKIMRECFELQGIIAISAFVFIIILGIILMVAWVLTLIL